MQVFVVDVAEVESRKLAQSRNEWNSDLSFSAHFAIPAFTLFWELSLSADVALSDFRSEGF